MSSENGGITPGPNTLTTVLPAYRRVIATVLGLLLIAAAGLKLRGTDVTPFAQFGMLNRAPVQFAAVEWELVLGVWLISGIYPVGAWTAALVTFLSFAGVSFYLGRIGQASCGCFGSIKASPWIAFGIDLTALSLLAIGRPRFGNGSQVRTPWRTAVWSGLVPVGGAVAICAAILGVASLAFGSLDAALARLRGEDLSIRPRLLDIGRGEAGQRVRATVEVVNRTDRAVRLIGGTSDCSCITTADLPLTLAPGEAREIPVLALLPAEPGSFDRKAAFLTDCERERTLPFGLTGRVEMPAP
jgi:hypothetical protein